MQYSRPGNALKKARNIKPFGVANRNRRPAFSPAFSSYVPGFYGGFLRPCRRRNSRLDGLWVKMPARRLRRPEAPGNCLPRSAPQEAPGQGARRPPGNTDSKRPSSICAAYSSHSPAAGTGSGTGRDSRDNPCPGAGW